MGRGGPSGRTPGCAGDGRLAAVPACPAGVALAAARAAAGAAAGRSLGRTGAGRTAPRGGACVGRGGVGVVGRCSSMRNRSVGGTTRPGVAGLGAGGFDAHDLRRLLGDRDSGLFNRRSGGGFGDRFNRRRLRRFRRHLHGWFLDDRFGLWWLGYGRRHRGGLHRLHQARRGQHGSRRLRRLGRFLGRRRFLAFGCRRVGEYVAPWQHDVALPREALDELTPHDLLDRARRALHLDTVIALEQRRHFLARRPEELCDLVNPDSSQALPLAAVVQAFGPPCANVRSALRRPYDCVSSSATGSAAGSATGASLSPRAAARIFSAVLAPIP